MTAEGDVNKALDLLNAFASVGVKAFDVTLTDLEGKKLPKGYYCNRSLHQLRHLIGPMLRDATAHQHNVIVRPRQPAHAEIVQLDDLTKPEMRRLGSVSLVVLQTSPGNYQAWVAVEDPAPDLHRHLRQGTRADVGASGATRISGSRNFKAKYAPHFPAVEILACHPGNVVPCAELESRGLVAPPQPAQPVASGISPFPASRKKWPSYQRCVQAAPPVRRGNRPDISKADFTWCMIALGWGWSVTATAARLMEESCKAQENGERYALLTAQNAAAAVARRTGNR
jgi:RepB DNA-primase from phage plasmid